MPNGAKQQRVWSGPTRWFGSSGQAAIHDGSHPPPPPMLPSWTTAFA